MYKDIRDTLCVKEIHRVEYAIDQNGESPGLEILRKMEKGAWVEDPDLVKIPDDEQITDFDKLRVGIEHFAEHGFPDNAYCTVNALRDGIWEFKKARKRVSFYDTDGQGGFTAKLRVTKKHESKYQDDDFWWIPDFDEILRIGHVFIKNAQKTDEKDIKKSIRIRKEDLEHDKRQ